MYNKILKSLRWVILAGMLYTLYTIMLKDDMEFNNQIDENVLLKMADTTDKSRDRFIIRKQLYKVNPQNIVYKEALFESVKEQANKLIDAHEKMLIPMPIGNYRYVKSIRFAQNSDGKYVLILNMTQIFNEKLDAKTQKTIKDMLEVTHSGMYKHYGFTNEIPLLLVPTFDSLDELEIIDLNRTTLELPELGADLTPDAPHISHQN